MPLTCSRRAAATRGSFSTAMTILHLSARNRVRNPKPAPASNTTSSLPKQAYSHSFGKTEGSTMKFCPRSLFGTIRNLRRICFVSSKPIACTLMFPREQAVLAIALQLLHNTLRYQFRRIGQFGTLLQILKSLKQLAVTLVDNLPHVFLPDARNQLQRVHSWRNRSSRVEKVDEPFFSVQHYSGDYAWK